MCLGGAQQILVFIEHGQINLAARGWIEPPKAEYIIASPTRAERSISQIERETKNTTMLWIYLFVIQIASFGE